jgi:hypothetical protein
VIRIIREEDEPKPALMKRVRPDRHPGRSDPQHAAALLAQARGIEIRKEHENLSDEKAGIEALLARTQAVEDDHLGNRRGQEEIRPGTARQAPHRVSPTRRTPICDAIIRRR